jgi:hypothetical protein
MRKVDAEKVFKIIDHDGEYYGHLFNCPGCGFEHMIPIHSDTWCYNGCLKKPSLSPSFKIWGVADVGPEEIPTPYLCHSFIVQGRIQFLDDCTHSLRGWHDLPPYVKVID